MPVVIAVIVGALLGAAWSNGFGMVVGAVLGWLVVRVRQQDRLIAGLQAALKEVQLPRAGPAVAAQPDASAGAAPGAAAVATPSPVTAPAPTPAMAPLPPPVLRPAPPRPAPAQAVPRGGLLTTLKAWLFGGNTIVKVGVAILFVGLAFLAKFATEHVQLPVELRLAGIAATALGLLAVGWRLRRSRPGYAQVLQGGAVAVLYLTLLAAFRYFGVLAVGPALALMVVVAALAAALAVLQDARALAVVGALGGFAAPLLVSTGSGNHVALFSYYLVLDLGIAAVAWFRTWRPLNLIGFAGSFIVATAWGVLKYQPEHYASSQGFLVAFFLLFVAIMLMPVRQRPERAAAAAAPDDRWVQSSLMFGLPTITFVLQHGLVRDMAFGTAASALVLAAFYVALAAWMRRRPALALGFEASLAVATVFLTLVVPFALDAQTTAGAWALEGAGLVWLGWRQSRGLARAFGYALLLLAGGAMVQAMARHGLPGSVWNAHFFNSLMVAAAALAAALFVQRAAAGRGAAAGTLAQAERLAEPLLIAWGTLWLLAAAAWQIERLVAAQLQLSAWLASVSAVALLCAGLSSRLRWPRVGLPAMAHAPLQLLGALWLAAGLARPFDNGGAWAWPLALLAHGMLLWRLAPQWPALVRDLVHALGVLVLATLGALQGRAVTAGWGDAASAWAWLGWLVVPAALLMLLQRPAVARRWPVRAAPAAYQWLACWVLAVGLTLWTLLANAVSNGSAQPLPHLPLLNPLDLGIALALVACLGWTRSPAARSGLAATPHAPWAVLGAAAFVWLNAVLVRAFHHHGGVAFEVDAWVHSLAVQTGITLLWTVTALVLMWLSARRAWRQPWLVGAVLLAAVVAKLLLVDQSGTGTVTRIVSFIGVGVLMLVIGYVAPLPTAKATHEPG